jgi:hypothetical protein
MSETGTGLNCERLGTGSSLNNPELDRIDKYCGVYGELCGSAEKDPRKTAVLVAAYNCRVFTTYIKLLL